MNDTDVVQSPMISNGVWQSPGDIPLFYNPTIADNHSPDLVYLKIVSANCGRTPVVVDDCMESPKIEVILEITPITT